MYDAEESETFGFFLQMLRTGIVVLACAAVLRRLQKMSITAAKRKANHGRSISSPDETGAHAFVLESSKGIQLYCRRWGSLENPLASVILVHSELLSGSTFKHFAEKLNQQRYVCYSVDLTGFGKSGCQQGADSHIESYTDYLDDLDAVIEVARSEVEGSPLIVYGEGLGATCALAYTLAEDKKDRVTAVIGASAKLEPSITAEKVESGMHGFMGRIWPTSAGPCEDPDYEITELFADAEVGVIARNNFESLQPTSIQKIREIAALCDSVRSNMEQVSVPLLLLHGRDDKRHDAELSQTLKDTIAAETRYLRIYPDTKHGIIYDDRATVDKVVGHIVSFIARFLPPPSQES